VLIGEQKAIRYAVENNRSETRNTKLAERLQAAFSQQEREKNGSG